MSTKRTSNSLIDGIKRRASIPESQATFDTEDFLEFANEEIALALVPEIMKLHEDFLLFEEDVAIEANKDDYSIPHRAIGNKLRDVQFRVDENHLTEMTRISIGQRFSEYDVRTETNLKKYYVKNNKIVLTPPVGSGSAAGDLVMIYYIKPSRLVEEDRVGIIKGISSPSGGQVTLTLSSFPDNFSALNSLGAPQEYDLYSASSPFNILKKEITLQGLNSTNNTVTIAESDLPEDLKVGDHISFAEECIIPQIPSDLVPMLEQLVACRILESMGDTQGLQNALVKLQQMQLAAGTIIDNRVDDSPQKIVNRSGQVRTAIFTKRFNRR